MPKKEVTAKTVKSEYANGVISMVVEFRKQFPGKQSTSKKNMNRGIAVLQREGLHHQHHARSTSVSDAGALLQKYD